MNNTDLKEIKKYFNDFLLLKKRSIFSDYIHNYLLNKELCKEFQDIINVISDIIISYLYNIKKEINTNIKHNNFSIYKLNDIVENYYNDISYISNIIDDNIYKLLLNHFVSIILTDNYVLHFLSNTFKHMENEYHDDIILLFKNIEKITKNHSNIYNIIINKISYIFINFIDSKETYISELNNIKIIYELNYNIKKVLEINNYFFMIKHNINNILGPLLYNKLLYIIKNNSIAEIAYTFKNLWYDISNIYNKSNNLSLITQNIILLLKTNNDFKDIVNILDIIITSYSLFNDNHTLDIIYSILNDKFESNDLLYDIMNYYYKNNINQYLNLLNIFININNKDYIINNHFLLLLEKLFNNYDIKKSIVKLIDEEKCLFYFLCNKLKNKQTLYFNKIKNLINDIELSYNYNLEYNNVNIIITSYENCNINYEEGYINSNILKHNENTQLNNLLIEYNNYYTNCNYESKSLTWYLHYGEIDITYNNKNIKLLPIQFLILELFDENDSIPINEINNLEFLSNYNLSLKNKIIRSLIDSNLLYINDNNLILNTNTNFETDLIEIYMNIFNNNISYKTNFVISRDDITKTNINHILKTKTLSYDDLYFNTSYNIKIFKLNKEIFDKAIEYLVNMDYIILENNKFIKL
jgi:hypothetical protein